jgi:S1-C subfamily serine protease
MEHLTKQQIVLLTLLVSFVTSLATGIVTVTLMDQAPPGFTQTISRAIDNTVSRALSSNSSTNSNAAASVTFEDLSALAVKKVEAGMVKIFDNQGNILGYGLVLTKDGVILADKSSVDVTGRPQVVTDDGRTIVTTVIRSQVDGDIVFLFPVDIKSAGKLTPIQGWDISKPILGQTVLAIGGRDASHESPTLGQGIVLSYDASSTDTSRATIATSITRFEPRSGSPVFDMKGNVLGLYTSSLSKTDGVKFYPISAVKDAVPK